MWSEQILTQNHLIEQRMQPFLLVYLRHRRHLLAAVLLTKLAALGGLLLQARIHLDCIVRECPLGRLVLLFDLRAEVLRFGERLLDPALFVLDVLVVGDPGRLVVDRVHVLIDAGASALVRCFKS